VIDLHNHVLPGLDDGPGTVAASVAMARAAAAEGTTVLCATPHVDLTYGLDPLMFAPLVELVRDELDRAGVEIELLGGAELSLRRLHTLDEAQLDALRLGGGPAVLLECPFRAPVTALEPAFHELTAHGLRVVLAHPERSPGLVAQPALLRRLVAAGAWCSITAASLCGGFGRSARTFAFELLREELVHNIASDAHDHAGRPPSLRAALAAGTRELDGFGPLFDWLVQDAPAAILEGHDPPPRPPLPQQQRGLFRRR
jgi:protein-tyrosine phosphatase